MNIVLGDENVVDLKDRYTVLPLDTFQVPGKDQPVKAYCVVESVPITEMTHMEDMCNLHEKLLVNYGKKNWSFCEQALEHLIGKWNHELDSFYLDLQSRIQQFKEQDPGDDWQPTIAKQ